LKRLLVLVGLVGILGAAMLAGSASAHPLGNFTVNHFAAVDLAGNGVYVRYALDLAEIPTYQEGAEVRKPGFAAIIAHSLDLRLDGERVPLTVVSHRTSERPGAGGLKTMRFDAVYSAPVKGSQLTFTDRAYGSRIGWREIVVTGRDGASVTTSSAPASSRSDELRTYPTSLLRSPLDVRSVSVEYSPGSAAAPAPQIGVTAAPEHRNGGFESLIQRDDLSVGVILLSLLIAAFWGAVHALTPGHGKALVAGYLVGTKGKPRHAFLLGATVTATSRRLRARPRHARPVAVHRPRSALPVADADLGRPRGPRRRLGSATTAPRACRPSSPPRRGRA
jgi:nickel/cobalt exporter